MKKGFTLVELLAVIVMLALILVIAVPSILDSIENSRVSSFKSSALLILKSAKKEKIIKEMDGESGIITCSDVSDYDSANYSTCTLSISDDISINLVGSGKFLNLECHGTYNNLSCNKLTSVTLVDGVNTSSANYGVTLSTLTKSHYNFLGWNTKSDGTGDYVTVASSSYSTLYAIWEEVLYTITLQYTSQIYAVTNSPTASVQTTCNGTLPDIVIPTYSGYTYVGYYSSDNTRYYDETGKPVKTFDICSDTTLYVSGNIEVNDDIPGGDIPYEDLDLLD